MNRKLIPAIAALLILTILFSATPLTFAVTRATIGPKLEVWTIPQDDQKREKGIIILGLPPAEPPLFPAQRPLLSPVCTTDPSLVDDDMPLCWPQDLMSQHKLLVTYNGMPLVWRMGDSGNGVPIVACNVLEKDKVNTVVDPKTGDGKQFDEENLMTKLVDVSDKFVCKPRWKSPAEGWLESAGVLDVYYIGPYDAHWIADHILVVEVTVPIGRTVVWGTDVQDICILGFGATMFWLEEAATGHVVPVLKPELVNVWLKYKLAMANAEEWEDIRDEIINGVLRGVHWVFPDSLGPFAGCEDFAMIQRDMAGLPLEFGPDPLA